MSAAALSCLQPHKILLDEERLRRVSPTSLRGGVGRPAEQSPGRERCEAFRTTLFVSREPQMDAYGRLIGAEGFRFERYCSGRPGLYLRRSTIKTKGGT
jgi:hypothetical protein